MMPVARIPLSALRVPDGKVGVTLAIRGLDPMSLVVEVERVEAIVGDVDGSSRSSETSHVFVQAHAHEGRYSSTIPRQNRVDSSEIDDSPRDSGPVESSPCPTLSAPISVALLVS